jgi:saccharopine dehydrogenase-like NADP-dependent oxidoreductase
MGMREGALFEENYVKKIYPQCIKGKLWSAIQVTTASSLCAVVDLVLTAPEQYKGFITQESFPLQDVIDNRFGASYR